MKLFSIPLLQFVIIIAVFTLINGNDETEDYPTDGDISLCEEESSPSEETCKIHSDKENACCFAELTAKKNNETLSKCMKIPRNYRFSLDFIETITIDNNEYTPKFTCNQVSQTCGTNNPNQIFKCREHSSNTITCCYIKDKNNNTNCILADSKFQKEVEQNVKDLNITCKHYFIKLNIFYYIILLWFIVLVG
jgi:hypothetical protein